MTEFRMRADGKIVTEDEYRLMYPNVGFPLVFTPDDADVILAAPQPVVTNTQMVVRDGATQDASLNWIQKWKIVDLSPEVAAIVVAAEQLRLREIEKQKRTAAVKLITVTTHTGKTFDGDEESQNRMARAILGLQAAGAATVGWTLANNVNMQVTAAELGEALALAGAAQAGMWAIA